MCAKSAVGQERSVVLSLEPSFKRQIPSGSSYSCNVSHSAFADAHGQCKEWQLSDSQL